MAKLLFLFAGLLGNMRWEHNEVGGRCNKVNGRYEVEQDAVQLSANVKHVQKMLACEAPDFCTVSRYSTSLRQKQPIRILDPGDHVERNRYQGLAVTYRRHIDPRKRHLTLKNPKKVPIRNRYCNPRNNRSLCVKLETVL
jgi:hypothetical protein